MAEQKSCRGIGLPKVWWWLLALVGFPLLYFFMVSSMQSAIEGDIQKRIGKQLNTKNFDWASINLKKRGRDVLLSGTAASEAERDQAIKTAQTTYGARTVDSSIDVKGFTPSQLSLLTTDNQITLEGKMPNQEAIDRLLASANEAFGKDNVQNKLSIGKRLTSPAWLTGTEALIPTLKGIKNTHLQLSGNVHSFSGVVHTGKAKTELLDKLSAIGDLQDNIIVKPLHTPEITASIADGKLTLKGTLSSKKAIAAIITTATEKLGAENIINKLKLEEGYAESAGSFKLLGTVGEDTTFKQTVANIESVALAGGLDLDNQLKLIKPLMPTAISATINEGKLRLEGTLASQDKVDAIIKPASEQLGADNIINDLKISETFSPTGGSYTLSGVVNNDGLFKQLVAAAEAASNANKLELNNQLKLVEPLIAPNVTATINAGELTLNGTLASQKKVDAIVNTLSEQLGAETIINALNISETYSPTGGSYTLSGTVDSDDLFKQTVAASQEVSDSLGLSMKNKLALDKPEAVVEQKPEPVINPEIKNVDNCQNKLDSAMQGKNIFFDSNQSTIKASSLSLLDNLSKLISECTDVFANNKLIIAGHTDSLGDPHYNLFLSQQRANSVKAYLAKKGISSEILLAQGFGESLPIAPNNTKAGRAENRRINFIIGNE